MAFTIWRKIPVTLPWAHQKIPPPLFVTISPIFGCRNANGFNPEQEWMLLLCDGGGSNNARHYIVKQDFCKLAKKIKMNLLVAHYPPYCSKYNPIEHRLFAQLHHAWNGCVLSSIQIAKELAEKTSTKTGLSVKVNINERQYQTKRPVCEKFKSNIKNIIDFDDDIPQWNYAIKHRNVELIF